jgi:hypothetical protein
VTEEALIRAWPFALSYESQVGEITDAARTLWLHPDIRYAVSVELMLHGIPIPVGFTLAYDIAKDFRDALNDHIAFIEEEME